MAKPYPKPAKNIPKTKGQTSFGRPPTGAMNINTTQETKIPIVSKTYLNYMYPFPLIKYFISLGIICSEHIYVIELTVSQTALIFSLTP